MIETIPQPSDVTRKSYPKGRVCSTKACGTILSIWNPRHKCAVCDPLPQILGKREHHDAMDALIDLMEESS